MYYAGDKEMTLLLLSQTWEAEIKLALDLTLACSVRVNMITTSTEQKNRGLIFGPEH